MEQHRMERLLPHMFITGKNHTDHPEENNIVSGHQHVIRIEIIQILCFLGPPQGRKRPQGGRKPGIQRILILLHMGAAAFWAFAGIFPSNHKFPALCAIIGRDPMPPPELTGNAPVTNIICPIEVDFLHALWQQGNLLVLHGLDGRLNQLVHLHKPLLLDHRLYRGIAAVMGTNVVGMGYNLYQEPLLLQILHHLFPGLIAVHAFVFSSVLVDGGVIVQHIDFRQVMALPHFKVVGVVGGSNLHAARAKFLIHIIICHNRNLPPYQRQD